MNGDTLDIFISPDQRMKSSEPVWCMTTVSNYIDYPENNDNGFGSRVVLVYAVNAA